MKIAVELTLAPLQSDYKNLIKSFISKLNNTELEVIETPLSTQVFGNYDQVMQILSSEVKEIFELIDKGILLIKIIKSTK